MKTSTKIRWLLFLVTIGLFATSLTARWASTQLVKLYDVADDISERLIVKEKEVYAFLAVKANVQDLKTLPNNSKIATNILRYFAENNIFFQVYKKGELIFWSDAVIASNNVQNIKDGTSFVEYSNGSFELIKKTDGDFSVMFFIPIKASLPFKNRYLNNDNSKDYVISNRSIKIANITDQEVIDIKSKDGKYLFSIKKSTKKIDVPYSGIEIFLWAVGLFTLLLLVNSICKYYADSGKPIIALLSLTVTLALLRYLGLKYHFPHAIYSLKLFDPAIFASSFYFPSFADFVLNTICFLWVAVFAFSYKKRMFSIITNKFVGYSIIAYSAILVSLLSHVYSDVFFGLIFNSNINLKVSNLVNLNFISFFAIAMVMLALLAYYLIVDILVYLTTYFKISPKSRKITLVVLFLLSLAFTLMQGYNPVFLVLIFAVFLIAVKLNYQPSDQAIFPALVLTSFIFATIVSVKLTAYETFKQQEIKRNLLLKLSAVEDPDAILSFNEIEKDIVSDPYFAQLLQTNSPNNIKLNARVSNKYLTNYLDKFDYKIHLFNQTDSLMSYGRDVKIDRFKKQVENSSIKISNYFYQRNNTFGYQNYFAIIPLKENDVKIGTLVLELNSKPVVLNGTFPQLLQNGNVDRNSELENYSYAFYQNKKLVNQYGVFIYDLVNTFANITEKNFAFLNINGYEHLIYKPAPNQTIVVTSETNSFWRELASLSFFFIIFLVFALFVTSYKWIITGFGKYTFEFAYFKKRILAINNSILYKTRIQIALVLAVVSSSLIIGIITFSYISIQYKEQQQDFIKSKVRTITASFEQSLFDDSEAFNKDAGNITFEEFAKLYNSDLNLFGTDGGLIYSTQYKMYAVGLIADRMNAEAYLNLKIKKKSEFVQDEAINQLKFTSAYMPIKNKANNVIAYLQLPYFANQDDYNQKIGTFLNLLINIYVLVFVVIGFFAFVVANQITGPLSLIQEGFSKTRIGTKHNIIPWRRNDEIGSLITEYNAMVETLEDNANKLAQSERETAWREMAKQVAHEIKNPLTPLRLGIQMLDRAWREKDDRFDEKFQKFSKSFLEQIDSLSHIASEFSNFAKMPELKLERIKLIDIIARASEIFGQMDHVKIICEEKGFKNCIVNVDKDQLLRSFNNLLKNAIEAIPEGKAGVINITGIQANGKIEIKIADNGAGIPLNSRSSIFTPNFTTKSSGTGLGLAFVKQAIQNVNGNIYFTTETDVGTTFYITLPVVVNDKK